VTVSVGVAVGAGYGDDTGVTVPEGPALGAVGVGSVVGAGYGDGAGARVSADVGGAASAPAPHTRSAQTNDQHGEPTLLHLRYPFNAMC
jgi:hypothetical protein